MNLGDTARQNLARGHGRDGRLSWSETHTVSWRSKSASALPSFTCGASRQIFSCRENKPTLRWAVFSGSSPILPWEPYLASCLPFFCSGPAAKTPPSKALALGSVLGCSSLASCTIACQSRKASAPTDAVSILSGLVGHTIFGLARVSSARNCRRCYARRHHRRSAERSLSHMVSAYREHTRKSQIRLVEIPQRLVLHARAPPAPGKPDKAALNPSRYYLVYRVCRADGTTAA